MNKMKKGKRGEILKKILEILQEGAISQIDFWQAFLQAGYGAGMGRLEYERRKIAQTREREKNKKENQRRFDRYIYNLKVSGLIHETEGKLAVSAKGMEKLITLRQRSLLRPEDYSRQVAARTTIISYDFPIKFNKERNRLREILNVLGFHMVHQSVWVGKVKVPENFIKSLRKLELYKFIEILEVTQRGTLREYNSNDTK